MTDRFVLPACSRSIQNACRLTIQGDQVKNSIKALSGLTLTLFSAWVSADALQVRSMAASCAGCHGTLGIAQQGMESLAGQSKEDLLKKMMDFKSGKKPATLMNQLSKGYSDEQIDQLTSYFAALKK
jgi:cytochrome c553